MGIPLHEWHNVKKEIALLVEKIKKEKLTGAEFEKAYNDKITDLNKKYSE